MDIKKQLGNKIKRLRQEKNLTQEQLAEIANISIRTLSGIEIGETFMSAQMMEKLLECLGVSLNDLFMCEHLKSVDELANEIICIVNSSKNNREKIENIYKVVKALDVV